ncbi:MAG TPA: MFS transporter, partial [Candidatus Limnocylindrales bacterium]
LLFFFLILFLQQVAGFSALEAGSSSIPVTLLMFALSMRFGALADKHGPRFFMGFGPLVAAVGMLLLVLRVDADAKYVSDVLPGLVVFGLGLSMTVAPLTSTVLADADDSNAGIASGVNNAIARVASLVAIAAVGAVVASAFGSKLDDEIGSAALQRPEVAKAVDEAKKQPLAAVDVQDVPDDVAVTVHDAAEDASVTAWRVGSGIATALVVIAGLIGLIGITNPRRRVSAADCPGGQLVGQPREGANQSPCDWDQPVAPIEVALTAEAAEASGSAR